MTTVQVAGLGSLGRAAVSPRKLEAMRTDIMAVAGAVLSTRLIERVLTI